MKAFRPVVEQLSELLMAVVDGRSTEGNLFSVETALNGGPAAALRRRVPLADLRTGGVFFTARAMAERMTEKIAPELALSRLIIDPACGAGDLLLACSRYLPVEPTLSATLDAWGERLHGYDISAEFVRATRIRLILAAVSRGVEIDTRPDLDKVFRGLTVGDFLTSASRRNTQACIVLNPPYSIIKPPDDFPWGAGSTSLAAVFVHYCLEAFPAGSTIAAILPDVLRSGTRYQRWREIVQARASVEIELDDQFDSQTDIHVFSLLLRARVGTKKMSWGNTSVDHASRVGDHFEVRVGPVVPHRDPESGPIYPYLHARSAPPWTIHTPGAETRAFEGTTYMPPFVVVRRTSRPEDPSRAMGTVITGSSAVAVENHLILLIPRSGSEADCKGLIENLRDLRTSEWLNGRIRCRHLTVSALADLPWWNR